MKDLNTKPVEILLVEDNEGDVLLTKTAFQNVKIHNNIHVVGDGEAALDYLYKRNNFEGIQTPDLILLDLNIPKKDGREVLAEIKGNEILKRIPVIVLTGSQAEQDVAKTYDLHANGYVLKPIDLSKFSEIVKAIESFWFSVVVLPPIK